ncbi:phosphatase [Streptomyces sulphureus]|uniref:phosphatase n=1 Tax=Streptomyces sulphureus TaxID=47758 RepID=UPI00099881CC
MRGLVCGERRAAWDAGRSGHARRLPGRYATWDSSSSALCCGVLGSATGRRVDITTRFRVRPYNRSYARRVPVRARRGPGGGTTRCGTGASEASCSWRGSSRSAVATRPRPVGVQSGARGKLAGRSRLAEGRARVGEERESVGRWAGAGRVPVPVDDAVRFGYYRALTRYVLNRACLSQKRAERYSSSPLASPAPNLGRSAHATRSHRRGSRCPTCAEGSGVTWLLVRDLSTRSCS